MSEVASIFNDPFLGSVYQFLTQDKSVDWDILMGRLGGEVERARKRRDNIFDRKEDPVLTSFERVMQAGKVQIQWRKIIYIGCSAGGDRALRQILGKVKFPHLPIVVAMHHNPGFSFLSKMSLANGVEQSMSMIGDDVAIKACKIYFVPGEKIVGYHNTNPAFKLTELSAKQRFRPMIDSIFALAGQKFHDKVVAMILTGMLNDGALGLKDVYLNRGETFIQTPSTAMFKEMPNAAVASVPTAKQLNLDALAQQINEASRKYMEPVTIKTFFERT